MVRDNIAHGLERDAHPETVSCDSCITDKMTNSTLRTQNFLCTIPGNVMHTDVCEMNETSLGGAKYFVTFTDEASGYIRAKPIAKKSEVADILLEYAKRGERQTGSNFKCIRLD